jgi:LysM repeat protein
MSDTRHVLMGFFMALLFVAILLGSLSLSLMESGYAVAQAPVFSPTSLASMGEPILTLVNALPGASTFTLTFTPLFISTPKATVTPKCPLPNGWVTIIVQPDDTLNRLASAYGLSVSVLASENCLTVDSRLYPGTELNVPIKPTPTQPCLPPLHWVPYTVRYGDTLSSLASRVGLSTWQLQSANCLSSRNVYPGQPLFLPYYPPVYYPPVYYPPYPTPTRWLTFTPRPPTITPTFFVTLTPTAWPSPTFTWLPTFTFTPPTVGTPTTLPTTELPPTDTSVPPPTDTPLTPPTNTSPPPPSATPLPPPTNTPLPPPTETPLPPPPPTAPPPPTPTDKPHPPPTATVYLYPYP